MNIEELKEQILYIIYSSLVTRQLDKVTPVLDAYDILSRVRFPWYKRLWFKVIRKKHYLPKGAVRDVVRHLEENDR